MAGLVEGTFKDLSSRGLREETLRKFGYKFGTHHGQPVHIAPYCDRDGEVVAQKTRDANKDFAWTGEPKQVFQLFGQRLWGTGGRRVIVTEGEIDAMTVSQVNDNKYPVVSVPGGAGSSTKAIERALAWLESFDEVVFMFDGDKPGREGAIECAKLLSPGKAKIAHMPDGEDPNSLLTKGNAKAIQTATWEAKPYRPDGLRSLKDLITEASKPVSWGYSLPFEPLFQMSYGPKPGQLWAGGAGVGIGKTDVFIEMIAEDLRQGRAALAFLLEQEPPETVQRIAAKLTGKLYFLPDCKFTEAELQEIMAPYEDLLHVYDHRGSSEWDEIARHIRFACKAFSISQVYVDNLTVLSAEAEDERRFLDSLLKQMKGMASELQVAMHVLSHLNKPEGTPHEEGGRVMLKQFTGASAVQRYANFIWGIERDTQADDEADRAVSVFRVLKDRLSGRANGQTFHLKYDPSTSRQSVCAAPPKPEKEAAGYGF